VFHTCLMGDFLPVRHFVSTAGTIRVPAAIRAFSVQKGSRPRLIGVTKPISSRPVGPGGPAGVAETLLLSNAYRNKRKLDATIGARVEQAPFPGPSGAVGGFAHPRASALSLPREWLARKVLQEMREVEMQHPNRIMNHDG
jgi:hypothetical protein